MSNTATCDSLCGATCCRCEIPISQPCEAISSTDYSVGTYILSGICIVLVLCGAYLLWRLKKIVSHLRSQQEKDSEQLEMLKNEVKTIKDFANRQDKTNTIVTSVNYIPATEHSATQKKKKAENPILTTRYGTLQAPDENGVLRFAERTMVETPSADKMFILELDFKKGEGTYRINSAAISLILSDLQMFKDYVKPFTFSGSLNSVSITDKKKGRVTHQGEYWVVEELLEITLK